MFIRSPVLRLKSVRSKTVNMSSKKEWVSVGDRKIRVSNLQKVLFEREGITKAEVIQYYLKLAPVMLRHIGGRPLTLVRYPDGLSGNRIYQKNKADWTPGWIDSVRMGNEKNTDYIVAREQATLAWLANLAAIELHQMPIRQPHMEHPDVMVFDLDPPDSCDFGRVGDVALELREHLQNYGYHPFVKTSGKKGLHLFVPLRPAHPVKDVFNASKEVAASFVNEHARKTTLHLKKSARKGRMLIDIYRNREQQTTAAPYSLRAVAGAPVSMPLRWEEVEQLEGADAWRMRDVMRKVERDGDIWEGIRRKAKPIHTRAKGGEGKNENEPPAQHKDGPTKLKAYEEKRDFEKTREPMPQKGDEDQGGSSNRFVIHRHHASRLHYDLRLERKGVLQSWAVPKGLPPRPGIKRLAVKTEDHPVAYLDFEGTIPQQEYGGGRMWIYARGHYRMAGNKERSLKFSLQSSALSGAFHLYRTGDEKWMLERTDKPPADWLNDPIEPMHGQRVEEPPRGDYAYEVKWDGIRALITLQGDEVRIRTRNGQEVTDRFPELQQPRALRATNALLDGEIVCLDAEGKPDFQKVIHRLQRSPPAGDAMRRSTPVHCYLFDCLYLDGRPLVKEPLMRRTQWLEDIVRTGIKSPYRLSEQVDDGHALFRAVEEQGLEGIMAKKRGSGYHPGKRSNLWLKVKTGHTADCSVIGFTRGRGDRSNYFGALHLAERMPEGDLQYRGKVGTGFDESTLREISELLKSQEDIDKPVTGPVADENDTTWIEPGIMIEVSYARRTDNGLFREAVFQRLRPDLFDGVPEAGSPS